MKGLHHKMLIAATTAAILLTNCHSNKGEVSQPSGATDTTSTASVETKAPNSNYKLAFAGQTRAPGVHTKTALSVTVINSSLNQPWGIRSLPDGRFLVSQKGGNLVILNTNGSLAKTITGLPAVVNQGQGGLLDVNIDPDFGTTRMIYWDYSEQVSGGYLLAVAKGKLSADETKLENIQVIYRANPAYSGTLQYGSRIVFDPQGNLFVSTGERSASEIRVKAQDLNAAIGKILHLT
jgi:glucose/arabinose dehydrogenase